MWIGTRGGLARFDGVRFTTFDDRGPDPLPEVEIWSLVETDAGLWIGTYGGGLARLQKGRFSFLSTRDGLVNDFVRRLVLDAKGSLWIGTDGGVSRFKDGGFTSFTVANGLSQNSVRSLYADSAGGVWIGTTSGIHVIRDGQVAKVALPEPKPAGVINDILRDRQGNLWIAAQDGLFRLAEGRTTRYTTAEGLSSSSVQCLFEDSHSRLWIATKGGLDRYTSASDPAGRFVNEAALADIRALGEDREGSLWAGSEGRGLTRLREGLFAAYTERDGLPSPDVRSVLDDRLGNRWIGTAKGLSLLRGGTISIFGLANGLPIAPVDALLEDRAGTLWVGTEAGLFRSSQKAACPLPSCAPRFLPVRNEALPAMNARVLYEDREGILWIGTNLEGLVRYQHERFTSYTVSDGLANDAVRGIVEDRDGVLWIGTKGGLDRMKDGTIAPFRGEQALLHASVQALYLDPEETLWIGTRHGLGRLKNGRFTSYTTTDGLYASHVYSFIEDEAGHLWMGCSKGIFRVDKKELDDFAEGRIKQIVSVAYGPEHGLPSTMAAVATHPASVKATDGRVWFATRGGLVVADPKDLSTNRVAPLVHIEEVRIDTRSYDLDRLADAPAGNGDLVFRYTALSFLAPEKVRFQYELEGFDRAWVDADTRRVAYYTNMRPGRYRFRVRACNNDGLWNEAGAEIELSLAPHLYETYWFYAGCVLALPLAGAASQRLRVRLARQRERQLASRVEQAVAQVKVLSGLLPICASCKKIRDDTGYWSQMETYIHEHSEAEFSHGICPACSEKLYPGYAQKVRDRKAPSEA